MSIITTGGLQVVGAQAMGGFCSTIHVKSTLSKDALLFDCGMLLRESISAGWVFITHGHIDHVGAAISHARARSLSSRPAIYYVPEGIQDALQAAREAFESMNGQEIPMDIRVMRPGESVLVGKQNQFRVVAFETSHRVESQGYAVYSTIITYQKQLLEEYAHLSDKQRGELRKQGVQITSPAVTEEHLDLVYTGDTTFDGLLTADNAFIFGADIIILECTYLDGPQEKAMEWQHIHLKDIEDHAGLFRNKQIVLTHLSAKYVPHHKALNLLQESALPVDFKDRAVVTLKALGANSDLTPLTRSEEIVFGQSLSGEAAAGGRKRQQSNARKCLYVETSRGCRKGDMCQFSHSHV